MNISVYGMNCDKCRRTAHLARRAVRELRVEAEVEHVENMQKIMRAGVLLTPAVAVDGRLLASGRVPELKEIKKWLLGHIAGLPVQTPKPRWIFIGGFLGAGKTTAIVRLARYLAGRGKRVSVISNDQGHHLVDTAAVRAQGFEAEEVPGGCFCCRFNSLVETSRWLAADIQPEVFIAEPVGSCTDLKATVAYPLQTLYRDDFTVAPVSVLLDPVRALQVFGLENGGGFADDINYIYRKQIEEADLLVVGKCDLVNGPRLASLRRVLAAEFPGKPVLAVSPRKGTNLEEWFERLTTGEQGTGPAMAVNYDTYARGEALLGWFNATVRLAADKPFDADDLLERLAREIQRRLQALPAEIAHLKMSLRPGFAPGRIGVVNLVRNRSEPELSVRLARRVRDGELLVNLRAEGEPKALAVAVQTALTAVNNAFPGLDGVLEHLEHFRPGKPMPTHRFKTVAA